jgi:hypothetical protein
MKVNILKTMSAHSSAGTRAMLRDWLRWLLVLTALAAGLHYAMFARSVLAAPSETPKHSAKSAKPKPFASAEEATAAFAAAVQAGDKASLRAILGSNGAALLDSADPENARDARERFTKAYAESHKLEARGVSKSKMWILVGKDDWPFPIPLTKVGSAWYFDAKAGAQEILNRRIGRNELSTTQAMLAYVDAQNEYYQRNPQNDPLPQYAQRFVSSTGKRDGLYFPTKAGEKESPLGPLFDARRAKGYIPDEGGTPQPYHGYNYKILRGQGAKAPGGAYDYVVNGKMIGGFALVAYPAQYGTTGIMTFIVNHDGVVYEKNLGRETAAIAQNMTRFDPDSTWKRQ